jgi:hypothetical protein
MNSDRTSRLELLERWEAFRDTRALVLATRPDASVEMGTYARQLYEHFREIRPRPLDRADLFLIGDGLSSEAAVRAVTLAREFARELHVVVCGAVGPGETLVAVGADSLVLHPMATLTTALPRVPHGAADDGLGSYVARLTAETRDGGTDVAELLRGTDPVRVGDALHRVEWARDHVRLLARSRVVPPPDSALERLVELLTERVQRQGEPIDRRTGRETDALPVVLPNPDLERLMFDVQVAYEDALSLLQPTDAAPRALIESSTGLHTLAWQDESEGAPRWRLHADGAVH